MQLRSALATSFALAVPISAAVCVLAAPTARWPIAGATALTWIACAVVFWRSSRNALGKKNGAASLVPIAQPDDVDVRSLISPVAASLEQELAGFAPEFGKVKQLIEEASKTLEEVIQSLLALAHATPSKIAEEQLRLQQALSALQELAQRNPVANSELAAGSVDLF